VAASDGRNRSSKWAVVCAERFLWERFEDGAAVYDVRSGQTHFLTPFAAKALELLGQKPLTESELDEAVCHALGVQPDSESGNMAEQSVAEFHKLGLISRIAP